MIVLFKWLWQVDRPMFWACITMPPLMVCLLIHGFTQSLFWLYCYYAFTVVNFGAAVLFWWRMRRKILKMRRERR